MHYAYTFDFGPKPSVLWDAWFMRVFRPVIALFGLMLCIGFVADLGVWRFVLPAIAGGAIALFAGVWWLRRRIAKQRIGRLSNTVFEYVIDDEGIHFKNEMASGLLKWGFRGKIVAFRDFYLLQSSELGVIPLPRDLPDEVRVFLKQKLSPSSGN